MRFDRYRPWRGCWIALVLVGGCASDHVVFVTKTSLGVDVEATPASASLAYDRVEGYAGPQLSDGSVLPVAGAISTDGKLFDRKVRQIYATGNAALIATGKIDVPAPASDPPNIAPKPMFFGTGTTLGLKLGFGEGGISNSMSLGYKRKEISVIPFSDPEYLPSVLATLNNVVAAATKDAAGLSQQQYFATGGAAETLALRQEVRDLFGDMASDALGTYRKSELDQHRIVLGTLSCLSRVADVELVQVWNNAEAVDLFHGNDQALLLIRQAGSTGEARAQYTRHLAIINAASAAHSLRLQLHREAVCAYATN